MDNDVFLERAGRIAGVGGWRVALPEMKVTWSKKTCEILDYPEGYQPTLEEAINLYTADSKPVIEALVSKAISDGTPYDIELKILTRSGKLKWVRSVGEMEYIDGTAVALAGAFQDVTDRKNAEAQIAQSLEETKAYYDNAPCCYYSLGPDRTILKGNDRLFEWLGCSREEAVGLRKPTEFMTPESLAPAVAAFKQLMEHGETNGLECELLPVNGFRRHVSISAKAYFDDDGAFLHSSSVMYDITDLVRQRTRADRLALDLMLMIDNDLVGTIIVRNRTIQWANKAMHRMFGYNDGELVGLATRVGYKDDESFQRIGADAYPVLQTGVAYKSEVEMVRKDGTPLWVYIHGMKLHNSDGDTMWMMSDVTELKELSAHAQFQAHHDALTGLPNRRAFNEISQMALEKAGRANEKLVFCLLDLDGFKAVNDTFGHATGDVILKIMTERLHTSIRKHDQLFRLGGDEFAIMLSEIDDASEIDVVLNRVLKALRLPLRVNDVDQAEMSGSIGVSIYPSDSTDHTDLMTKADRAMYAAKRAGKDAFVYYGAVATAG